MPYRWFPLLLTLCRCCPSWGVCHKGFRHICCCSSRCCYCCWVVCRYTQRVISHSCIVEGSCPGMLIIQPLRAYSLECSFIQMLRAYALGCFNHPNCWGLMPWNALSSKCVKWYHMHIALVVVVVHCRSCCCWLSRWCRSWWWCCCCLNLN